MRKLGVGAALGMILLLGGCASSLDAIPPIADTASFIDTSEQVIKSGDSVRVVVFGHDALSGTYPLDADGMLKLGPLGAIPAKGLTSAQLEQKIATLLSEKGINEPQVSVMID